MALEKAGRLCRIHGGAVSVSNIKEYHSFEKRITENDKLKDELFDIAVEFIEDFAFLCAIRKLKKRDF